MNSTYSLFTSKQQEYLASNFPFYYTPRENLVSSIPDHWLSVAAPVVAYWFLSLLFHFLDISEWKWLDRYRIHESQEVKSRNLVTRVQVIRAVIFQQVVQTVIGLWWMEEAVSGAGFDHVGAMARISPTISKMLNGVMGEAAARQILESHGHELIYHVYWWLIPATRFIFGIFILDTWQYFLHRAMHMNTYLYKTLHSVHHRLYVPYAFGALYNHPIEGFLLDTLGAAIAEAMAGMTMREAILLFVVSTCKTVDDHCGYKLPWDPLQFMSQNNADYHDIHHQVIGIKSNFSQPFFIHWDVILGTRMTREDIARRREKLQNKSE